MMNAPNSYISRLMTLGSLEVSYGAGGITLRAADELQAAQIGYAVDAGGHPLVADKSGGWASDWYVIGNEMACGDPIFLSVTQPNPVFTAVHGDGRWKPSLAAPSIEAFWRCLDRFTQFANKRANPVALEENAPSDREIESYLRDLISFCGKKDYAAVGFWATQAEIGMEDERWQDRLERLLKTGKLD